MKEINMERNENFLYFKVKDIFAKFSNSFQFKTQLNQSRQK